jgi:hypothetical protein
MATKRWCWLVGLAVGGLGCGGGGNGGGMPDLGVGGNGGDDMAMAAPSDQSVPPMIVDASVGADLTMPATPPDLTMVPLDPVLLSLKFETSGPITVAVDKKGGPVIAGGLINSARFGDITLAATAEPGKPVTASDLFTVGFAATGKSAWGQRYGDVVDQLGSAVAVNADGVVLVAGLYSGELRLSPSVALTSPSETNFVAAFDAAGAPLWARTLELGAGGFVLGVAADPSDKGFVLAATATAAASFGSFNGTAGGAKDIVVAKVAGDAAGTLAWARQIGGTGDQVARAVAIDSHGAAFVVGQYTGVLDFGGGALPTPMTGARNLFAAKLDGNNGGAQLATRAMGARGTQLAEAASIDGAGNLVMAGYLAGPAVLFDAAASIQLTPRGQDGFVAALRGDLTGALWAQRIGDVDVSGQDGGAQATDPQEATAVAVDGSGHVVVVGTFKGTTDFGVGTPLTAGGSDAFALGVAESNGKPAWVRTTGGSLDEKATAVGCNRSDGSVWVAGTFTASTTAASIANWGQLPMNELVFATDDGSQGHTFLVHLR